jgi:LPS-assembly lipoprotein
MSLPDKAWSKNGLQRISRLTLTFVLAGLVAGCFQPLYGERSLAGGPGINDALAAVDVSQIVAPNGTPLSRIAVETRNQLLFGLTGGGHAAPPTHKLVITLTSTNLSVIVDIYTNRPDIENFGIDATYSLTEIATNKVVLTSQTFSRVSYDIPGQQQRFARQRALRDAENRAANVIAEQIRTRLASYFVAGS